MNEVLIKPQFDLTDFYLDFFEKGIMAFDGTALLADLKFHRLEELDSLFPGGDLAEDKTHLVYKPHEGMEVNVAVLKQRLIDLHIPIESGSLKHHFYEYRTNDDVLKWHNDNGSRFVDHDVTINCFLDEVIPQRGGRFDVCRYSDDISRHTHDHPDMWSIYPKKFTIVIFNQSRDFLHKVQKTTHLRRMVSYAGKTI